MTVYVDELVDHPRTRQWPYGAACHLFADDLLELHQFASKIGMRRAWFQNDTRLPHYDLTESRRMMALTVGAIEADHHKVFEFIYANRQRLQL